jgi:hypothetical protein
VKTYKLLYFLLFFELLLISFLSYGQNAPNSQLTAHQISYNVPTLNLYNTVRGGNSSKGQMIAIGLRWLFDK